MPDSPATLHMICGKIAAGKSTLAAQLARAPGAVLISEDAWLAALFGDQMTTPRDYVRCAAKLRTIMGPHITGLLQAGVTVVLDFPANTLETRDWMRRLIDGQGVQHQMHVLAPPDAVCLARLRARNASGEHPFAVTDAQFHQVSAYFVPPSEDEGFALVHHRYEG